MKVIPDSINLRMSDREIPDGSLQESINMQWTDGVNTPIPYRELSDIKVEGFSSIIAHKIGDENTINILGFWTAAGGNNHLYQLGTMDDGVYEDLFVSGIGYPKISADIVYSEGLSYSIISGVIYFMSTDNEFYYSVQYNESDSNYIVKDMYSWKDLQFSKQGAVLSTSSTSGYTYSTCGVVFVRYSFVLNTGEEVLHSTIYPYLIYGINNIVGSISAGTQVGNIHTAIKKAMLFDDEVLSIVEDRISAVNVYCSIPKYKTTFENSGTSTQDVMYFDNYTKEEMLSDIEKEYDTQYYLVQTNQVKEREYNNTFSDNVLLYAGEITDNNLNLVTSKVSISTIAAGKVMPTDNFTHHKLYGNQESYNGRSIVSSPKTKMTLGTLKNNAICSGEIKRGFTATTEDGVLKSELGDVFDGASANIESALGGYVGSSTEYYVLSMGLISYPDTRANGIVVEGSDSITDAIEDPLSPGDDLTAFNVRKTELKSTACANNNLSVADGLTSVILEYIFAPALNYLVYDILLLYNTGHNDYTAGSKSSYTSENRLQFTEAGEFSVFPVTNSYRIGDGKLVFVGNNRVNPESADLLSPLIVGTTDGIYTVNFDKTGVTLVNSITKTANLPALSSETLEIDGSIIFVSDRGLMAVNGGKISNLTEGVFLSKGSSGFPQPNTIYPNIDECLDISGTPYINPSLYVVDDIIKYMSGAVFAFDGNRNNIWCSNSDYNYSLLYSAETSKWSMSQVVFDYKVDYYSNITDIQDDDYYTRALVHCVSGQVSNYLAILSSEIQDTPIVVYLLTRPIKLNSEDIYKKVNRIIARCQIVRDSNSAIGGIFSFGVWGKQDLNRYSKAIPIAAIKDDTNFKDDVRQDIPIGRRKGKYKSFTIMLAGEMLPSSSLDSFDFDVVSVDDGNMR